MFAYLCFSSSFFARKVLSAIQYNLKTLLELRWLENADFKLILHITDPVLPCVFCLPARRLRTTKTGKRAGTLSKTQQMNNKPPPPSTLLANVQSLDNKLHELHARIEA